MTKSIGISYVVITKADILSIFLDLPEAAVVQMNIGVCYAELGERQEAELWLRKCVGAIPPSHRGMLEENLRRLQIRE